MDGRARPGGKSRPSRMLPMVGRTTCRHPAPAAKPRALTLAVQIWTGVAQMAVAVCMKPQPGVGAAPHPPAGGKQTGGTAALAAKAILSGETSAHRCVDLPPSALAVLAGRLASSNIKHVVIAAIIRFFRDIASNCVRHSHHSW
jgi:hypothetical protein